MDRLRTTEKRSLLLSYPPSQDNDADFIFKIVLIGDAAVGKTCLLQRFRYGTYSERHNSTIGVDYSIKNITVDGKTVKLHMWDTAGQERFRTITHSYYRNAHGVILAYDLTNERTFNNLMRWVNDITRFCGNDVVILLIGTKADIILAHPQQRAVEEQSVMRFVDSKPAIISSLETSAKNNMNIEKVFHDLSQALVTKHDRSTANLCDASEPGACIAMHHDTTVPLTNKTGCCS